MGIEYTDIIMGPRKIVCVCVGLIFGLGFWFTEETPAQQSYRDLTFPELTFTLPDIAEQTLDNGLRVFLAEDHELPVIRLYALVKAGSIYEPVDKVGLADVAAEVLRTGGTASRSADEVNETLEFLASDIEVDLQSEFGAVEAWTLAKNFDATLEIFVDLLRHPAFAEANVDLTKARMLETIRRRNDEANEIVGREFLRLIYGAAHPLARIPQPATIHAITRHDLVDFHQTFFQPNTMMLAVTGDFTSAEMAAKLQAALGDWTPREVSFPDVATAVYDPRASVHLASKDVDQTTLMLGHLGIKADNADYAAVTLLDSILGSGSFSSRLYQHIRNDLGLAYVVGSYLGAGLRDYGAFMIYCGTGSENVGEALRAILAEIRDLRDREVGAEELRAAQNQYLNSFVFEFATVDDVVRRRMLYASAGYPADFLTTMRERVLSVTSADLRRVAQTYLHPDRLTILAVGQAAQIRPALAEFGDVQELTLDPVE